MEDLDFSALTDDQLLGLIRAACIAAVSRGPACGAAARGIYISETERARVIQEASELEAVRLRQAELDRAAREAAEQVRQEVAQRQAAEAADREKATWRRKKGIAAALDAADYDVKGDQVVAWKHGTTQERRIFLQQIGHGATYATLYVTGNRNKAPGRCEISTGITDKPLRAEIRKILAAVAAEWTEIKVDLEQALAWAGEAIPLRGYEPPARVLVTPPPAPAPEVTAS